MVYFNDLRAKKPQEVFKGKASFMAMDVTDKYIAAGTEKTSFNSTFIHLWYP